MGLIQENINRYIHLEAQVKEHPMCFLYDETKAHIVVRYPFGVGGLDGVRVSKTKGKANALDLLLERMEKDWKDY